MAESEPGGEIARSELRASHDDRDRVVELLRVSAGDGRLTAEELDERLEQAMTARTYGELARLVADLISRPPTWSVRLAGAYDLFGTGKTALKLNAGKYVASQAAGYAANFNGMTYSTQQRGWNDADRNGTIFDANGNARVVIDE